MMSATLTHPTEGERRKLAAFSILAARREVLIRRGRRALLSVLIESTETTADDVRAAVELPDGIDPKAFGAVPGELATAGIIVAAGFTRSTRTEAHARPLQIWRLVDHAAAVHWLAYHPDLPDVEPQSSDDDGDLFDSISNKKPGGQTPGKN